MIIHAKSYIINFRADQNVNPRPDQRILNRLGGQIHGPFNPVIASTPSSLFCFRFRSRSSNSVSDLLALTPCYPCCSSGHCYWRLTCDRLRPRCCCGGDPATRSYKFCTFIPAAVFLSFVAVTRHRTEHFSQAGAGSGDHGSDRGSGLNE